jgi:hypothetical protein
MPRVSLTAALLGLTATLIVLSGVVAAAGSASTTLFLDTFDAPNGSNNLITNEYAYWNAPSGVQSSNWQMDSGSTFFYKGGSAYTGIVQHCSPDADSTGCTDSAIFRLTTRRYDFGNVLVQFDLYNHYLSSTGATPPVAWDGVHIFLHYQSEYSLYYASVNRRDGHLVIKKKCPGGPSNDGTYYELGPGEVSGWPIPFWTWQRVGASIRDNNDGSVTIDLYRNGVKALSATDTGVGCAPITAPGATGIRGDNDAFRFDNFRVTALG